MDTEKQRQCRRDDARMTENRDVRSEQLLMMPTESLLTNGEWLPIIYAAKRALEWIGMSNTRLVFRYEYQTCLMQHYHIN